jgi:hypothetical protein
MNQETLLAELEYWADCLANPTYNSLEVGFRHNPLTEIEIIQRYKETCDIARQEILRAKSMIEKDGIH